MSARRWKEARRSRTAERSASGGGAPRASRNACRPTRVGLTKLFTAVTILLLASSPALACPVCFGAEETSVVQGTRLGIMVMLGIVLVVQGAFVAFFLYLRKRMKQNAEIELDSEWSQLQRASRTS